VWEGMKDQENYADMLWNIRLAPHANPKIAANDIVNYVIKYNVTRSNYYSN
jgi:hypothetical protein